MGKIDELASKISDYLRDFGLAVVWSLPETAGTETEGRRRKSDTSSRAAKTEEKEKEKEIRENTQGGRWSGERFHTGSGSDNGSDGSQTEGINEETENETIGMPGGGGGGSKVPNDQKSVPSGIDGDQKTQVPAGQPAPSEQPKPSAPKRKKRKKLSRRERKLLKYAKIRSRKRRSSVPTQSQPESIVGGDDQH